MENIKLGVYRRLYNRLENLPDDSERAVELHNNRKVSLHEILDNQELAKVIDWGDTDDINTHEYVELIIGIIGTKLLEPILISGIKEIGKKLAEKAIDETTSEFVKWIISKFIQKQNEKKIQDFHIKLKNGTSIRIDPPDWTSEITINFADGEVTSIKYQLEKE
jgi:ATP-dependent Clp protease adapter protein ClpS